MYNQSCSHLIFGLRNEFKLRLSLLVNQLGQPIRGPFFWWEINNLNSFLDLRYEVTTTLVERFD